MGGNAKGPYKRVPMRTAVLMPAPAPPAPAPGVGDKRTAEYQQGSVLDRPRGMPGEVLVCCELCVPGNAYSEPPTSAIAC